MTTEPAGFRRQTVLVRFNRVLFMVTATLQVVASLGFMSIGYAVPGALFAFMAPCLVFLAVLQTLTIRRKRAAFIAQAHRAVTRRSGAAIPAPPGVSTELAGVRLAAAFGPCNHGEAEPVKLSVTGETVAWLCPRCDLQLPPEWR